MDRGISSGRVLLLLIALLCCTTLLHTSPDRLTPLSTVFVLPRFLSQGSDFQHEQSEMWMTNLDSIIDGVNAEGTIKAMYSTPSIYLKAKHAENVQWSVKTDDFFPYADGGDSYWTGSASSPTRLLSHTRVQLSSHTVIRHLSSLYVRYFTSRPALKRYIRLSSAFLQVARHMELFSGGDGSATEALWEAQSVAQHHDAVSGTAKQQSGSRHTSHHLAAICTCGLVTHSFPVSAVSCSGVRHVHTSVTHSAARLHHACTDLSFGSHLFLLSVTFDYAQRIAKGTAIADELVESTLASIVSSTGPKPALAYCPLANVSQCDVITNSPTSTIVAILYNPTARVTDDATTIFIPSSSKSPKLYDAKGQLVNSTTLPVFANAANTDGKATFRTFFRATVPGLGVQTYFLAQGSEAEEREVKAPEPQVHEGKHKSRFSPKGVVAESAKGVAADSVLENEGVAVTFDGTTGLIKSITDKASQMTTAWSNDFAWYPSYQVDNQQDSGAYIFRPTINGTISLSGQTKLVNLVNSPIVSEAWQQITPWLTQIVRLRAGARGVEFEWTVGPIPVSDGQGKEIIIRFNTSLASKGTFHTDRSVRTATPLSPASLVVIRRVSLGGCVSLPFSCSLRYFVCAATGVSS